MPSTLNAPGIYIEELPSGVRPIVGVSTSDTAFVDWFPKGPEKKAVRVTSFDEFTREFGGLHKQSHGSYAVLQYFLNGGAVAWIVRAALNADKTAKANIDGTDDATTATVTARSQGSWGNALRVAVTTSTVSGTVNVVVGEEDTDGNVGVREIHRNLPSADVPGLLRAVNAGSSLIELEDVAANNAALKEATADATGAPQEPTSWVELAGGADASVLKADGTASDDATATALRTAVEAALDALARIEPEVFNLLCLPSASALGGEFDDLADAAAKFCRDNFAFLILDPPMGTGTDAGDEMVTWFRGTDAPTNSANAAIYWPRLVVSDALARGARRDVGPSGAVAGIFARTDATRGVWKAPAGIDATIAGADLAVRVNDADSQRLNPLGVNVLRTFPVVGNVVWGARTTVGADVRADQWKYIPVRRTALFIEQSLRRSLKWVVFEPNDEPLWASIRLNVGSFLQDLFRKGAFQGTTPRDAYFVRCDRNTTPQSDIDKGVVNILVGFAPLKPAEFVVIQIQQMAGSATA